MPRDPGEALEKITLNAFKRDMDLLRSRYPAGGHLTFIQKLLRAWANTERREAGKDD